MSESLTSQFGLWRSFFWPIRRDEFKKFIPMFVMLFLLCFNYGILRSLKDTLIITASGARVIPFIKVWGILPSAVLFTFIFTKLTNRFSQERVFYLITSSFLLFYIVFGFILYPLKDYIHPHTSADFLEKLLPSGLAGLIELYRHWSFSLFYIISELWSSVILHTLFWGLANEVTRIQEAKRFYGVLGIASNLAALVVGFAANGVTLLFSGNWGNTVSMYIAIVSIFGVIAMFIFRWQNQNVYTKDAYPNLHQPTTLLSKKKKKMSLKESFAFLSKSKYLMMIAALVVSYNLVINLMDVVWKDRLNLLHPTPQAFNYYMNNVTSMIGLCSLLVSFFIPKMIEKMGWTRTALLTPISMAITGLGFFAFLFFNNFFSGVTFAAMTPLAVAVFFGGMQHCLSKAAKYSIFDATKEMSFIPLDHDIKFKGKAPIDVVAARLGKSGGSLLYQGLLIFLGTIAACIPYVAIALIAVLFVWIYATRNLGKMFNELVQKQSQQEKEPAVFTEPATS